MILGLAVLASLGFFFKAKEVKIEQKSFEVDKLKSRLSARLKNNNFFDRSDVVIDDSRYELEYTVDKKLEKYVKSRLRYYRPDKSAVVVMDNATGDVLTAIGYDRKQKNYDYFLPFSGTHPSASIFKIVTSAELIEDHEVDAGDKFAYRGKGTTLYKYQLKNKKSRWQRNSTFERAFARSNNVIFGKAAIKNTTPIELREMAERLGFNQNLMEEIELSKSIFITPSDGYNLAEIATGFNKKTLMSPVHCAVLSSIIANEGELVYPRMVKSVKDLTQKNVWENTTRKKRVISKEVAVEMSTLMSSTITKGTARRKFRRMNRKIYKSLDIGGKTGSITGGFPMGKRDWFTAYARPRLVLGDPGISVCVMNINFKKWYVKSTKLAQEIIQYYYKKIK